MQEALRLNISTVSRDLLTDMYLGQSPFVLGSEISTFYKQFNEWPYFSLMKTYVIMSIREGYHD